MSLFFSNFLTVFCKALFKVPDLIVILYNSTLCFLFFIHHFVLIGFFFLNYVSISFIMFHVVSF